MKIFIHKYYKWILMLIFLILFFYILNEILSKETISIDNSIYNLVSKVLINDNITPIVKIITFFGGTICLCSITILLFILLKNKKIGIAVTVNLIITTIINQALKGIIQRDRPINYRIIEESGYSFPSGHSMASLAFYGFLIYLIFKKIKNVYIKWILILVLSLLIFLIGLSRIYLGIHYASDVISGFILSIIHLIIYISVINKLNIL